MGMGPIVWTCLALTVHQVQIQEYFLSFRAFKIPIRLDAKKAGNLQSLILLVSRDKGKTWEQVDRKSPGEHEFVYRAPEDGHYWFIVQQEDRTGRTIPSYPERVKPNMAVIVDTTPPQVKVTAERLPSGEIHARWTATDAYLDPRSLRLAWHTSALPEGQWTPVGASPSPQGEHTFPVKEGNGTVRVRVQIKDQAGNMGEDVAVLSAATVSAASPPPYPPNGGENRARTTEGPSFSVIPPTYKETSGPPTNQLVSRQTPRPIIEAPPGSMLTPPPPSSPSAPDGPAPFPAMPIASPVGQASPLPQTGTSQTSISPPSPPTNNSLETSANLPALKIVREPKVRIDFTVGRVGPSGLGNADVYVTFDKGQTWQKMPGEVAITLPPGADLHGPEVSGSVGVQLPAEGKVYGFLVAVKSKAGLAPPPPKPGDPPQALVELDTTAPKGELYAPQLDPTQPNTLLLAWKAEDRNLGDKPITLEWAEQKDGPWNLIGGPLPNTGQYSWRLPEHLPPRVYLRLTMRDIAGNESRAQTPKPELIDLSVPQTKIIGVAPATR
jgi:hypothetical protein